MSEFPSDSINLVVTSPPYWGLRDYGGDSQIWGGDPNCEHELGDMLPSRREKSGEHGPNSTIGAKEPQNAVSSSDSGNFCIKCGAWKGQLGLEPHPQMFVDHLVEIFREVKRVLKPSGSFWLNLGDSYYGSRGNNSDYPQTKNQRISSGVPRKSLATGFNSNWLQPKQKLMIPERTAIALQDDGWILRNSVIWYKPNHMPESVGDRLSKSYEFFFFFVKQQKYYFDLDSIRKPYTASTIERVNYSRYGENSKGMSGNYATKTTEYGELDTRGGNPGDMWSISTKGFPGSHFAVFPEKLIEPIIKSSSQRGDVVLDPFCGSGTTLKLSRKLMRSYIGIDTNPEYVEMSKKSIRGDKYFVLPDNMNNLSNMFSPNETTFTPQNRDDIK